MSGVCAPHLKIPNMLRSKNSDIECCVSFKNLTDSYAMLYWIDFRGKAVLQSELPPIGRDNTGYVITTFVTHPWVATANPKIQLLLNRKRYFFPPRPNEWELISDEGFNKKWICEKSFQKMKINQKAENNCKPSFEVLIEKPGVEPLLSISLKRCCELLVKDIKDHNLEDLDLPKSLKLDLLATLRKYFL